MIHGKILDTIKIKVNFCQIMPNSSENINKLFGHLTKKYEKVLIYVRISTSVSFTSGILVMIAGIVF